jgi:hypothetical protein
MTAQLMPESWLLPDYEPRKHLMQLKGKDYLNVQNRTLWFITEQRKLISIGQGRVPYLIQTEAVDVTATFALFKTTVRDVLGNESTDYGSETAKDFGDYIEKASTKSQGRALLGLGYGTAFAPETDEGERVVDAPREKSAPSATPDEPYETVFPKYSDAELKAKSHALFAELDFDQANYEDDFYKAIGGVKSPQRVTREDRDKWFSHLVRIKSDRIAAQEEKQLAGLKKMREKIQPGTPEPVDFTPEPDTPLSFPAKDAPVDHDLRELKMGGRAN